MPDGGHVLHRVEGVGEGGAEFIVGTACHEERGAFPDAVQYIHTAAGLGIASGAVLNVHGHVVRKAFVQNGTQHRGIGAVGVQLDLVAQQADPAQQVRQVRVKGGLAAGDAHALQPAAALLQEGEELVLCHAVRAAPGQHQRGIVAEGAAEITAAEKHGAGDAAGKIQQRQLLQSRNLHTVPSFARVQPQYSPIYRVLSTRFSKVS